MTFPPTVLSDHDTIARIVAGKLSVSRFGDGEAKCVEGAGTRTQLGDPELTVRMREILKSDDDDKVLVCILDLWSNKPIASEWNSREKTTARFGNPKWVGAYLKPGKVYGDAAITRLSNWALGDHEAYWTEVRKIWDARPVLVVSGSKKGRSAAYGLLDNAAKVEIWDLDQKIGCWSRYPNILHACARWARRTDGDPLVYAAIGATATVLAYDLGMMGVQCLDAGHMAQSYSRRSPKELDEP